MNLRITPLKTTLGLFALGTLLLTGCKKDPVEINPTGSSVTNGYVNNWILDNMRGLYYWNTRIPANPDTTQAPDAFFESLLHKYNATTNPQGDRFSWIQESATELTAALNGETKTTGLDFTLVRASSTSTDVVGVVTYVLPGSPADKAGMKRNDMFYSVNGVLLTTDEGVLGRAFADESVTQTYGIATVVNGAITKGTTTKAVTPVVFQENPVYKDSVYTVGSRKIGYLMYNQFVPEPNNAANSALYDNQVNAVFGKFKAQGVNELILDLRYNGGGYTSSSQKLASLMVKGVSGQSNALFYRTEYNNVLTAEINKETNRDQILNTYFSTVANNIGSQISRVYVLTTRRTASASELIINGLRPYMTVNTIGTTSYGKNVGSITISDTRNKENKWGMQPIVSRSFNKNNESDYWTGFVPTVAVNEPYGALVPIGDLRDPLLATAINHMNGLTGGRRAAGPDLSVGSSDDFKPGANSMFSPNPLRR